MTEKEAGKLPKRIRDRKHIDACYMSWFSLVRLDIFLSNVSSALDTSSHPDALKLKQQSWNMRQAINDSKKDAVTPEEIKDLPI